MQPDDLYRVGDQSRELPASELLQAAVRAEFRRQEILEQIDRYIAELIADVGEPTAEAVACVEAFLRLFGSERGVR